MDGGHQSTAGVGGSKVSGVNRNTWVDDFNDKKWQDASMQRLFFHRTMDIIKSNKVQSISIIIILKSVTLYKYCQKKLI